MKKRSINYIVIHESASQHHKPSGKPFTIADIDNWHVERGFKRTEFWRKQFNGHLRACGYHYVIEVDGMINTGRDLEEVPAAVKGFNAVTANICLIGKDGHFTKTQTDSLKLLLQDLKKLYPDAEITGHYNPLFHSGKTCPGFDVEAWVKSNLGD